MDYEKLHREVLRGRNAGWAELLDYLDAKFAYDQAYARLREDLLNDSYQRDYERAGARYDAQWARYVTRWGKKP